jgi:signal transduction histidine kinase
MELARRNTVIYSLLVTAWVLVLGWQTAEHSRVEKGARAALVNRAKDISTTLGIVLRSQRRWGVISKERLESTLNDLVKAGELKGIALLNAAGEVVASAGVLADFQPKAIVGPAERWEQQSVTLMNLVDLGTNVTHELERANPPIVLPREEMFRGGEGGRPPPPSGEENEPPTNRPPRPPRGEGRPRFARPPWMSEEEFKTISQKQGVHGFVIVMSTRQLQAFTKYDLWLRGVIVSLATISVVGFWLAWRNLAKFSDLQLRLVRASQLTSHLKEMNLAAAGLAHETRNPLNIIRGLAQMITKQPDAPGEIRDKSRAIVEEADKVTAQLNEFINYSRPRELRRVALSLPAAIHEVIQALGHDLDEKKVRLEITGDPMTIEADEQLLRQALFNLVFNAIQAVPVGGEVRIVTSRQGTLEVRDNGPGVPPERRQEIFKPYFTTRPEGAGLGLAIVQQIVLAHGWEIKCVPNEPNGAIFRITHLKLAGKA